MEAKTMKTVFTVVDRGQGRSYWTRVGVGFVNSDGSLTLRLDAIPTNGTLQVRDWQPYEQRDAGARAQASAPLADGLPVGEPRTRQRSPLPASVASRDAVDERGVFPGDALA
ncbi:MAG TPA: hypothetical protein VGI39_22885 [Polyangiaceae bacterium]|jgi:hypothetical protein